MFILPDALAALRRYPQFICFRLVPRADGKTDKMPCHPLTGEVRNAHDRSIWTDVDTASVMADLHGLGVGFVFAADDPFWFIDVDNCLEGNDWSATAQALMQRFAGSAVEISQSGRGLHLFGCGTAPTPRKIKYAHYFDLYTDNRFVALTGNMIGGDIWTDHTAALADLVRDYLTPDATVAHDWTDGPRADWSGPTDDAELIDRMMRSNPPGKAFGDSARFSVLWEADETELTRCYPHSDGGYDKSSADSALAQTLAFWTGCDCARMERLMRLSALARDKYDREDYLPRTIMGCVSRQYQVLNDKPLQTATGALAPAGAAPAPIEITGSTYADASDQRELFKGCIYVTEKHRALVPGGALLKPDQFRVAFGGYSFPMDPGNERTSRNAWEAFTESQCNKAPRSDGLCFRPDRTPGEIIHEGGQTLANLWWPITVPREQGDAGPFIRHLEKLFPDADDRLKITSYIAAVVQHQGVKFQWAPLVQGVEGNGKTFLIRAVANAVGERYTHLPNTADLSGNGGKFTGWLQGKIFIGLEEIYTADRREVLESLKPLITNSRIEIQAKGADQITGDNRANFFACTNHKDAIPKTNNDRRWGIFYTAQQEREDLERDGMNGNYFPDLWDWFYGRGRHVGTTGHAIITDYLMTFAIPDELNPAVGSHRAPATTSTDEAIRLSVGGVEQEILEAIEQDQPGFAGGWVSSIMLDKLLQRIGAERRIPPRRRVEMMATLGYYPHAALDKGRVNNSVTPDGGKPKLFAKKGHIVNDIPTAAMVANNYQAAQNTAISAKANFGT